MKATGSAAPSVDFPNKRLKKDWLNVRFANEAEAEQFELSEQPLEGEDAANAFTVRQLGERR